MVYFLVYTYANSCAPSRKSRSHGDESDEYGK